MNQHNQESLVSHRSSVNDAVENNEQQLSQKLNKLQVVEKELPDESADIIGMSITPPVFDNRFTRMKLKRDVLVRTDKGFLEFFNLNSHLTLNDCWEK